MKRNWLAFLGRAIAVIFFFALGYEAIKALLNAYPQIKELPSSSNLIIIVIVWLIIPVCGIGILYGAYTLIRRGFDAPRLNWAKGLDRLATVLGGIIGIILSIIFFMWLVKETGGIVAALVIFIVSVGILAVLGFILQCAVDSVKRAFRNRGDDEYE